METIGEKLAAAAYDLKRLLTGWRPEPADLAKAVHLKNWLRAEDLETGFTILIGDAVHHPLLGSQFITTSPVVWLSEDLTLARTVSRWYLLSSPAQLSVQAPGQSLQ